MRQSPAIAEALRHFLALNLQETIMHPDIGHHGVAEGAGRLRDLVLMMRKHKINAAAMDIEHLTQMRPTHRGAFDMPSGTAEPLNP